MKTIVWLKILAILAVVAIMAIAIPSAVFAADPTSVIVNWNGGGTVTGTATAGNDATYNFQTSGSTVAGQFNANNYNDNPYGYGVNTSDSYINADVISGYIFYEANKTDNYVPMYGSAGQTAASFVSSSGLGEMATGSWNNYAEMTNGTYGKTKTTNGYNYEAAGTNFAVVSYIGKGNANFDGSTFSTTSVGNNAYLQSIGSGTVKINDMTNGAYGSGTALLGLGGGCYTNANAVMTGSGQFTVGGVGTNSISKGGWSVAGNGNYGSVTLTTTATYNGPSSIADYSLTVQ